jgi:O-acetylserine/cysteine efflux transporter
VAPFSLLVPVVAMAAAWLLRGEEIGGQQAIAAVLVIGGMACTVIRRRTPRTAEPGERTVPELVSR